MKLKLKQAIVAGGVQYLPPAIVDTDEIGITQADADVLVRRGTAQVYEAPAEGEETAEAPAAEADADVQDAAPAPAAKTSSRKR